jgi:hypothetical protein
VCVGVRGQASRLSCASDVVARDKVVRNMARLSVHTLARNAACAEHPRH